MAGDRGDVQRRQDHRVEGDRVQQGRGAGGRGSAWIRADVATSEPGTGGPGRDPRGRGGAAIRAAEQDAAAEDHRDGPAAQSPDPFGTGSRTRDALGAPRAAAGRVAGGPDSQGAGEQSGELRGIYRPGRRRRPGAHFGIVLEPGVEPRRGAASRRRGGCLYPVAGPGGEEDRAEYSPRATGPLVDTGRAVLAGDGGRGPRDEAGAVRCLRTA